MSSEPSRIRIENELFARLGRKGSEETQANLLMSLLMDHYPLLSAVAIVAEPGARKPTLFAHRGLSHQFVKEIYAGKALPVLEAALGGKSMSARAIPGRRTRRSGSSTNTGVSWRFPAGRRRKPSGSSSRIRPTRRCSRKSSGGTSGPTRR